VDPTRRGLALLPQGRRWRSAPSTEGCSPLTPPTEEARRRHGLASLGMGQRQRIAKAVALPLLETVGWEGNERHCIQEANANLPPKMPLIVGLSLKQPKIIRSNMVGFCRCAPKLAWACVPCLDGWKEVK
jgi:hypothetical protein